MTSLRAILTSTRSYVIFAVIAALLAFLIPEYFDRVLLGGSLHPLGLFQRSIIAMMVGIFALLAGLALHLLFAFIWKDGPGDSRKESRAQRRKASGGGGSSEGGHGYSGETAAAGVLAGGEIDGADSAGSENFGEAFGGGDAGGGGSGGDYGGGDYGGGDGGGGDGGGGGGDGGGGGGD